MRTILPVTVELACGPCRRDVEMELDVDVAVISHTPAEPGGPEHPAIAEEWEIEVRLAEPLLLEEAEVLPAGQLVVLDARQRRAIIEELRDARE